MLLPLPGKVQPTLALNPATLQLGGVGVWVDISLTDSRLLEGFVANPGRRLTREQMLGMVGKQPDLLGMRALEVQIVRLRKKLLQAGAAEPTIKAIRGVGYQLCIPIGLASERRP